MKDNKKGQLSSPLQRESLMGWSTAPVAMGLLLLPYGSADTTATKARLPQCISNHKTSGFTPSMRVC